MAKSVVPLTLECLQSLEALGRRLRSARLRRLLSAEEVAALAGMTRQTLNKIESGIPTVTIGSYLKVLQVFGLDGDINEVASDTDLRRQLREGDFLLRERAPRRTHVQTKEDDRPNEEDTDSSSYQ